MSGPGQVSLPPLPYRPAAGVRSTRQTFPADSGSLDRRRSSAISLSRGDSSRRRTRRAFSPRVPHDWDSGCAAEAFRHRKADERRAAPHSSPRSPRTRDDLHCVSLRYSSSRRQIPRYLKGTFAATNAAAFTQPFVSAGSISIFFPFAVTRTRPFAVSSASTGMPCSLAAAM